MVKVTIIDLLFNSAQRLNDLGDESKLLPLWRQVNCSKFK